MMINKKFVSVLLVMLVMALLPTAACGDAGIGIEDCVGNVSVPIFVTSCDNVGAVDVTLSYDPSVVTVTEVVGGDMDMIVSNTENVDSGIIRIVACQVRSDGLSGEFSIAEIHLMPLSDEYKECELNISVTTFKECTPESKSITYSIDSGTYETIPKEGIEFFWEMLVILVGLIILVLYILLVKQKR